MRLEGILCEFEVIFVVFFRVLVWYCFFVLFVVKGGKGVRGVKVVVMVILFVKG